MSSITHHHQPLTMSAFRSSRDDEHDDDMIITLLLPVACDLANKTSLFWTLFSNKHDDALITLCGFTIMLLSAKLLHQLFKPFFDSFTPCRKYTDFIVRNSTTKKGRPRILISISFLALGLAWTRSRGSFMIMQIIFGLTHGSLSNWLSFSRQMTVKVLLTNEDANVRLPTADKTTLFATMINQK
jgi:hypothetical protein